MANTVVTVFTADIGDLKDKTSQAQASLDQLASTAKKAGDASKNAGNAAKDFGDKAGKAGQSSAKMAGALGLISPAAANAARNLSDLADVGEVAAEASKALGISMGSMLSVAGPVAIAVGALAATYYVLKQNLDAVDAANEKVAESTKAAQKAHDDLKNASRSLADQADIATGKETAKTLALRDGTKAIQERYAPLIAGAKAELEAEQKIRAAYGGTGAKLDQLKAAYDGLNIQRGEDLQNLAQAMIIEPKVTENKEKNTVAIKEEDEALKQLNQDMAINNSLGLSNEKTYNGIITALYNMADASNSTSNSALENAEAEHKASLQKINDLYNEAIAASSTPEAYETANAAKNEAIAASNIEFQAKKDDIEKKSVEDTKATTDQVIKDDQAATNEKIASQSLYFDAASNMQSAIVSLTSKQYDTTTAEGKKAALKQWKIQHAAAVAQVLASAILGVAQSAQIGYPQNIPGIIASVAQGAASTAAILSTPAPKFHMGSSRVDEVNATLQRGEAVVTSQAMSKAGMREAVQSANAGYDVSGGRQNAQPVQYLHKVYNEFIRDNIKVGSPLTNRIDKNTKVGHRTNRK